MSVQGVRKRFGTHQVLNDLTFHVEEGQVVGLLGPNGSGKTTTVRLINGLLRPDAGTLRVDGRDPLVEGDAVRQISGVLTETAGLYGYMTGLQNLRFFAELYGVDDPTRAGDLLELVGLTAAAEKPVATYSTGMRKRLGLAKALLHRPRLLFLDEPTTGLDPEGIRMVLAHIRDLNRREGITVLICSHLLHQLEDVCDRYVFIDGGRVVEEGSLADLERRYGGPVVLEIETDLEPGDAALAGMTVERAGPDRLRLTLPDREAVPGVLRNLTQRARVYGAAVVDRDLETLYFRIREGARR